MSERPITDRELLVTLDEHGRRMSQKIRHVQNRNWLAILAASVTLLTGGSVVFYNVAGRYFVTVDADRIARQEAAAKDVELAAESLVTKQRLATIESAIVETRDTLKDIQRMLIQDSRRRRDDR